jgi:hypothetical protein
MRKLALTIALASATLSASADSVTYTASTGSHGGLFPLFSGRGLYEVDIAASLSGGRDFANGGDDAISGTAAVYLSLAGDAGAMGWGEVDVPVFAPPHQVVAVGGGLDTSLSVTGNLSAWYGVEAGFFAHADVVPPLGLDPFGPPDAEAAIVITYWFSAVPEPSGLALLATACLLVGAFIAGRAEVVRRMT